MAKNNGDGKLHVAMLPWLAFGHLIPYLELAKLMATKGHKISFISTPKNIHRLPPIPKTLTPFINFIKIDLPKVKDLPENAESTKDLPFNKVKYLKIANDGLQKPIQDFLKTSSPNWIIYDFATYWLGSLASELGIRTAFFSVFPAVMLGFLGPPNVLIHGDPDNNDNDNTIIIKRPKWVSFETQVRPSLYQLTRWGHYNSDGENMSDVYRLGATVDGCDAVFVRSSFEFEPDWLNLVKRLYKKPVIPVGFLPSTSDTKDDDININNNDSSWLVTKQWLDKQEKGSVVYIAFGSEAKPSQYELTQLALGIELCGLPFYWVLIDQRGASDEEVIKLPIGFEERMCGRGVVCREWAPQFKILSHDSVGGLLIHSGMSSVIQGFQLGKPLVLLPFSAEQDLNATYLVEKKLACMVPRDVDGSFEPESLADSLSLVIVKEEGNMYRDKAKEMMSLFGNRDIQDQCLDELLHFLSTSIK
uniref:UDP-glycosyltransferase 91A1-like n=1 Tax=Erigeron canadensis TaxID=72917 RepID=UPI001CB8D09C|nr:UDP-glycosyltransferase 91A1-like [Erigeron canadensis]